MATPTTPNSGSYVTKFGRDSEIWWMHIWKDVDDVPIQNSTQGPFPKPTAQPVSIGVIRATVRKTSYTDADYKNELNAINSGSWRDWGAKQAWIAKIKTKDVNEGDVDYVLVRYLILTCEYGWDAVEPDIGYYHIEGGKPKVFVDEDGMPYLGCLDGSGAKLAVGNDMIISTFEFKRQIAFSLGF